MENLPGSFLCDITSHQRTGLSLLLLAPSGWQVLCCCCAILKRRERNRRKKFPHQPPSYSKYCDISSSLCHYHVTLRWKNAIFFTKPGGWNNSSVQHGQNAWMCIDVHISARKFTFVWSHLKGEKGRIWIREEHVWIWFEEKQAGEENVHKKHNSSSILTMRKHCTYCTVYVRCSTSTPSTCNSPTSQRWNRNSVRSLTSLVKQCTQRGAVPASESSISSSWISGWTSDRWQPVLLCVTHTLAHFEQQKKLNEKKKSIHCKNICLYNSHTELSRFVFLEVNGLPGGYVCLLPVPIPVAGILYEHQRL